MTLPAWKAALLDKKYRRDEEGRKRQEEEDWQLEAMPAWKRDLVLKKRAGVQLNSWRVTPRPATVSTNFSQGSRTAVTVKPVTATSKNNSQDKVASEAPTHNHVHSADETDSPARTAPIDAQDHEGVSEEHVTSVHDNPFFKLERKRLNSGSGERPVLNRKPPSRNEVDELNRNTTSTTTTTTGSSNTNTTLPANQTKTVSYSSGNMTSTPVDSNKNKPYEPEVIIIPKPKNRIIVDNRMIEQRQQEPVPKQIRLRTRSLSPAARVVRRQLSGESESSSPRSPSSESPMHSPRSVDNENEESVEKGTVNKLLGLFGKAATPDDLRRGRFNSLERNTYTKPKLEGVVKSTHSLENSSKPPLPPSAVVKKAPITPMTTVTTQRKYSAPSKPVVVNATPEPKPEAKPAETTSVPSKESEEVVNEEPVARPRRSRKKKLDASTIISLENSGHPTAKQENYAKPSVSAPTEDKPMKIDERSNEDDTDIGRHKKVHPLEIKTEEDRNEVIKPNTVSNIRNSFSEYNGPVPVPVAVPSSKKRRAPPPPQQPPFQKQEQTSRNNSAKVTVGNTEQTTLKPVQANKDEGKPTKTSEGNKPASEPVAKPVQPTPASTTQIKQTSIKKVDQQSVVSKQPTQQNNISKRPTQQTVVSKQPMQQPSISKQTIIMTPVKPDSQTTKSDSEVRQAVEELKSVGTTFRITPRTNNTTASNSISKKETKIVLAPSKTSNENEKSAKSTKKTVVLKTNSNTGTVQAEKETTVSPVNHIPENKDDVPVTNIDDIPVSNIDDFLSPPTSPTPTDSKQVTVSEESVSVVKNANSETPKTVQNGTVIVNGTNEVESKKTVVEPVNDFVKPPLKRISGGKFKKITNYQFIGENAPTGKPSMLTKSRTKKRNITFNDSATVKHMYPSEESLLEDDEDAIQPLQESDSDNNEDSLGKTTEVSKAGLKSNTALTAQGGLQSYTPSHLQDAYMNSLEKRKQEQTKTEEKKEKEAEPAQPDVIAVKPLDDKDADYFSTSSSSTALMF
ncbi:uncharacterized protein [Ptychodera flava]|uniref:uncharacterized protein n=1 Tax=Ptychodera flava TaxID=63121 RepID=UPI00396A99B2